MNGVLPGDLQVRPKSGASVWIAEATGTHAVKVTPSGVYFGSASASNVVLDGDDLADSILGIGLRPGVGAGNVLGVHVAPGGEIGTARLGGILGPDKGGTGRSTHSAGLALAVASDGTLGGVPGLRPVPGGLDVQGGVSVAGAVVLGEDGTVCGRSLLDLHRGSPPWVDASVSGRSVSWSASDRDGDLRRVAVRYLRGGGSYTREEVRDLPDDWYAVDEGAYEAVFVAPAASSPWSPPYFDFFKDKAGLKPRSAFRLRAGGKYRFELAVGAGNGHPFWIGDSVSAAFSGFPIEATPGRGYASGGLLGTGSNEFIQFSIPRSFSGNIYYFCTTHSSMRAAFRLDPASLEPRGDPVASLSGLFDASGRLAGDLAFVVAEDAAGNLNDPAVVAIV